MAGELPAEFLSGVDDFIAQCVANDPMLHHVRPRSRRLQRLHLHCLSCLVAALIWRVQTSHCGRCYGADASDGEGNYIYYGVREFAMAAMMNGIALHGGFIPYGGTFLIFMEYARNAVRMAALMKQRAIYVFTHDSVGLGEDGPTHQPVEQLTAMRSTPNLDTWRPCDAVESLLRGSKRSCEAMDPQPWYFLVKPCRIRSGRLSEFPMSRVALISSERSRASSKQSSSRPVRRLHLP